MADDSMEISSEHGQNVGEDIDIDIDITAGQPEEDYMLQDALSSADYGNKLLGQPSPMHHDDPMVDDDNASYQMDDAELIHDEIEYVAESELMSFAPSDDVYTGGDRENTANAIQYSEHHDVSLLFDHPTSIDEREDTDGHLLEFENVSHPENIASVPTEVSPNEEIAPTDETPFQEAEEVRNDISQHESEGSASPRHSPAPPPEQPGRSPASISVPDPLSFVHESNDKSPEHTHNDEHEELLKVEEPSSAEHGYDPSKARDVKVVYQSVEYSLFSTSELDNPDSFFLSDLTIVEKPLDQFFQAIREIIRDDLSVEDELCVNVEDLGLETEEACSSIKDVTLAQILTLHQKLLQNDGVESPRPLCLLLGTRVNFSKRLASLTEGASLDKGLSELVVWEENSESLEEGVETLNEIESHIYIHKGDVHSGVDSTEGAGNEEEEDSPSAEHIESVGIYEEEEQLKGEEVSIEAQKEQHREPEEDYREAPTEQGTIQEEEEEADYRADRGGNGEPEEESRVPAATEFPVESDLANASPKPHGSTHESADDYTDSKPLPKLSGDAVNGENNEEDDLIDYSDEEIQYPEDQLAAGRRSAVVADESRTDNEYQAKDEELRHRSLSRQAEEKLLEESVDQTYVDTYDGNYHDGYIEENETGYEDDTADFQHGDQSDGYELVEHTEGVGLAGQEDLNGQSDDLGIFEYDEASYQPDLEDDGEGYHGIDQNDYSNYDDLGDEEAISQGLPIYAVDAVTRDAPNFQNNNSKDGLEHPAPSTASSLGAVETAESSVTLGAEEIQYEDDLDEDISNELKNIASTTTPTNGSALDQKDEIDYEDDEDEEVPVSASSEAVLATKELPNPNGKRPIEEVGFVTSPNKDAKRPRS